MEKSENMKKTIASRLSIARKHSGLSQQQVANIMNYHRPTISEIEAGRRNVTADELIKFAEIYNVSMDWLTGNTEQSDERTDKIRLAARELSKLKDNDLNEILNLLSALKRNDEK